MKERDAGGMREDDIVVHVEHFLRRYRTLVERDTVDDTRRDLPAPANLQRTVPHVYMCRRESQHLPLMLVLDLHMRDLLDDIGVERDARGGRGSGGHCGRGCEDCQDY